MTVSNVLIKSIWQFSCNNCCVASADVVITADEGVRGGKTIPLKATVDNAVEGVGNVRRVFVMKRTGAEVNMQAGRDVWLEEVCCYYHGGGHVALVMGIVAMMVYDMAVVGLTGVMLLRCMIP